MKLSIRRIKLAFDSLNASVRFLGAPTLSPKRYAGTGALTATLTLSPKRYVSTGAWTDRILGERRPPIDFSTSKLDYAVQCKVLRLLHLNSFIPIISRRETPLLGAPNIVLWATHRSSTCHPVFAVACKVSPSSDGPCGEKFVFYLNKSSRYFSFELFSFCELPVAV